MQAFNKLEFCLLRKMFPFKIPFFETPGVYIFLCPAASEAIKMIHSTVVDCTPIFVY